MSYSQSTALRHIPKQVRGQRKVDHIVRSAEALFAEVGYENATTNAIAARAGVSIGSLYQFFSSKDAILGAMADRYLKQTKTVLSKGLDVPPHNFDQLLTGLLEALLKLQEQRPYFLQCLNQSRLSPVVVQAVGELFEELTAQVVRLLERGTTETDPKVLKLRARICVETASGLLPLALRARGKDRTRVVSEIKGLLMRYLEPTLRVRGVL